MRLLSMFTLEILLTLLPIAGLLVATGKIIQIQTEHAKDISEAFDRIRELEKQERIHHDRIMINSARIRGVPEEDITDFG